MRTVRVSRRFAGSVHEAETLWYDTSRWPTWIDGLSHVDSVSGPWPERGAKVIWDSFPEGRGRVVEKVITYEPLAGAVAEVEDESIRGRQSVAFTPADDKVDVAIALAYEIKQRSIVTPAIDLLFIRRAMLASLGSTLRRFGVELAAERGADLGD